MRSLVTTATIHEANIECPTELATSLIASAMNTVISRERIAHAAVDLLAALYELEELLADTLRIASFVRCDMDCLQSGDIHYDDCMISQYNAVEDKARNLLRGGRFEVK